MVLSSGVSLEQSLDNEFEDFLSQVDEQVEQFSDLSTFEMLSSSLEQSRKGVDDLVIVCALMEILEA